MYLFSIIRIVNKTSTLASLAPGILLNTNNWSEEYRGWIKQLCSCSDQSVCSPELWMWQTVPDSCSIAHACYKTFQVKIPNIFCWKINKFCVVFFKRQKVNIFKPTKSHLSIFCIELMKGVCTNRTLQQQYGGGGGAVCTRIFQGVWKSQWENLSSSSNFF